MTPASWAFVSACLWLIGSGIQTHASFRDLRHDVYQIESRHRHEAQRISQSLIEQIASVQHLVNNPQEVTGSQMIVVREPSPGTSVLNATTADAIKQSNTRVKWAFAGWLVILLASIAGVVATWPW